MVERTDCGDGRPSVGRVVVDRARLAASPAGERAGGSPDRAPATWGYVDRAGRSSSFTRMEIERIKHGLRIRRDSGRGASVILAWMK